MSYNRKENIAQANALYWDRQRAKLQGVADRKKERAKRSDLDQLRLLDKYNLTAKRERKRLIERIPVTQHTEARKVKAK